MRNKILKSILAVAAAVLILSLVIITGVLYKYFGSVQQSQLKDELRLASKAVSRYGLEYLSDLEPERYRLTWISQSGTVLFDSQVDAQTMENHADREEIREAIKTGTGSSSRYSTTLTMQNIYEAVRLEDGSILRISESRATVFALVMGMVQPIVVIIIVAAVLSVVLANRMAKRVVKPLNELNLDKPMDNEAYDELAPLLRRIHAQQLEIKKQLHILRDKQEEFNQITGNMKESLVLLDNAGRIVSINPAAKKLFETDVDEGADFVEIDRRHSMKMALQEALEDGEADFRERRDGREIQFELNRIDSDNKAIGMAVLGFDITDKVNAEKNRREFTANVTHELKTPLQSIIGSAELMENKIVKQEDMPRFIGHIRKEASRLVNLIDDIIRLSQLDEGQQMPGGDISLRAIAEEVREILDAAAKEKNIVFSITGDEGVIYGVERLLYEIVYNLCDNAIKYNKENGEVVVDISEGNDKVYLSVRDSGIGIAVGEQEKIFERFYRVDKSHSKQSGGTGLGLSIVKHAVMYHHGKISVDSRPDNGTIITVVFNRARQVADTGTDYDGIPDQTVIF